MEVGSDFRVASRNMLLGLRASDHRHRAMIVIDSTKLESPCQKPVDFWYGLNLRITMGLGIISENLSSP